MTSHFSDRKKQKLYAVVEKSGTAAESVPADVEEEAGISHQVGERVMNCTSSVRAAAG
jgi:hypothetical protein